MASDSDRLLAEGRTLTLHREGVSRAVTVRYDMRGVKYLEDYFGSLEAAGRALDNLATADNDDTTTRILAAAGLTLAADDAAKLREALNSVIPPATHKRAEATVQLLHAGIHREMGLDEVWEWTEMKNLADYYLAMVLALMEAMPGTKGSNPNVMAASAPSRGTNRGRRRSTQAAVSMSSGA